MLEGGDWVNYEMDATQDHLGDASLDGFNMESFFGFNEAEGDGCGSWLGGAARGAAPLFGDVASNVSR